MSNKPLLTIAIPTYNRSTCLVRLLNSIINQEDDDFDDLEVIICDNASTDDTPVIVKNFLNKIKNSKYYQNEQNLGMDGNFKKCFELSNGEYFWMIGDDDQIADKGLSKVLSIIKSRPSLDMIHVNSTTDEEGGIDDSGLRTTFYFNDADFISNVKIMFTFISGMICKKSAITVNSVNVFSPQIYGKYLMHLAWQISLLKNGSNFAIIHNTIIQAKQDNSGGYHLYKVFSCNLATIFDLFYSREHVVSKKIRTSAYLFLLNFLGDEDKTKNFTTNNYLKECDAAFMDLNGYKYIFRFFYKYTRFTPSLRKLKMLIKRIIIR